MTAKYPSRDVTMTIPNCFIVGAPKCGTTSLYNYLSRHPNVYMSSPKEPHFFCTDFPKYRTIRSLRDYTGLFAGAHLSQTVVGEASTHYLASERAANNIYAFKSDAKIVVMFRDPVEFVRSYHQQLVYSLHEPEMDLRRAWDLQSIRKQGREIPEGATNSPHLYRYAEMGALGDQARRLLTVFPRHQVLFIVLEEMRQAPESTCANLLRFLGLPSDVSLELGHAREARVHRARWLTARLVSPPSALRPVKKWAARALNHIVPGATQTAYQMLTKRAPRYQWPPGMRDELREYFAPQVVIIERLLGRQVTCWR